MKIIHVYTSELKKLPKDKFKEEGIEQTLIEKAPYYGKIIAQNHNGSKVILKLVKEIKDLYSEPTAEDLAHFKNLGIQYEEIKEIPVGYFQTVLARKYGAYLSLKNIPLFQLLEEYKPYQKQHYLLLFLKYLFSIDYI